MYLNFRKLIVFENMIVSETEFLVRGSISNHIFSDGLWELYYSFSLIFGRKVINLGISALLDFIFIDTISSQL